ncbi:protein roadkill-like [Stegodyphus dumicola]|uniref:protein roadkill-like n=1 Tax=Stegodyphus dumicola TaxID=202533 RepID=UPI0015AD280C|nr:protein roadkill-like [Stegodyphus dumicola]
MACENLCFKWTVNLYEWSQFVNPGCSAEIRSPSYSCNCSSSKWYLHFSAYDSERILNLYRVASDEKLEVKGKVNYVAIPGRLLSHNLDCVMHSGTEYVNIFNTNNNFLLKHEVTLMCDIYVRKLVETCEKSVQTLIKFPKDEKSIQIPTTSTKLKRDMRDLCQKCHQSDFVLVSGDVEIPVHKCILFARSPVFAQMFQHAMTENTENRMVITDVQHDVLEEVVQFMYCGEISPGAYAMASDLYYTADKYSIWDLKDICREYIISSISISTVIETLILADRHQDNELRQHTMNFVASMFKHIKSTEAWVTFKKDNVRLANEIMSFVLDQIYSEES